MLSYSLPHLSFLFMSELCLGPSWFRSLELVNYALTFPLPGAMDVEVRKLTLQSRKHSEITTETKRAVLLLKFTQLSCCSHTIPLTEQSS